MWNLIILIAIVSTFALAYTPIYGVRKHGFVGFIKEIFVIKPGTFKLKKSNWINHEMY